MLYMVTFTINIPQMLAYIPYMDPMGTFFWRVAIRGNRTSTPVLGQPRELSRRFEGHIDCKVDSNKRDYHLVMTNSLPWKDPPFLIGKPR